MYLAMQQSRWAFRKRTSPPLLGAQYSSPASAADDSTTIDSTNRSFEQDMESTAGETVTRASECARTRVDSHPAFAVTPSLLLPHKKPDERTVAQPCLKVNRLVWIIAGNPRYRVGVISTRRTTANPSRTSQRPYDASA